MKVAEVRRRIRVVWQSIEDGEALLDLWREELKRDLATLRALQKRCNHIFASNPILECEMCKTCGILRVDGELQEFALHRGRFQEMKLAETE